MHPTLEKVDNLYRSLKEEINLLTDRHIETKDEVDKLTEELNNLKAATREEAMKIEQSRNELDQEKNEFEAFRTEALQQMETYREGKSNLLPCVALRCILVPNNRPLRSQKSSKCFCDFFLSFLVRVSYPNILLCFLSLGWSLNGCRA